jgi:hypothetical protein
MQGRGGWGNMLDVLIQRMAIQLFNLGDNRMNLRGVVAVETVQTTMFRRSFLGVAIAGLRYR